MEQKTFSQYLEERFVNALPNDTDLKKQYTQEVWDILQSSYKAIGGIKGNGFKSPEDMLNIPMWKMARINGKIVAVVMYKDKGGRKTVASGTDGSVAGKKAIVDMVKNELKRSYGEKSKASLGLAMKLHPFDVLEPFLRTPDEVARLSGDKVIAVSSVKESELPEDAKLTLAKFPQLRKYGYLREIGGKFMFKVMMGTPNKSIK